MARARKTIDQKAATDAAVRENENNSQAAKDNSASETKGSKAQNANNASNSTGKDKGKGDRTDATDKTDQANKQDQAFYYFNREVSWLALTNGF
jgi:hypothetical protein